MEDRGAGFTAKLARPSVLDPAIKGRALHAWLPEQVGCIVTPHATPGCFLCLPMASAQLAVSANDNKVVLVNGVSTIVQNPPPDTIAIIDLKQFPPKVLAEIEVPVIDLKASPPVD
jgi:hypothetical protein